MFSTRNCDIAEHNAFLRKKCLKSANYRLPLFNINVKWINEFNQCDRKQYRDLLSD